MGTLAALFVGDASWDATQRIARIPAPDEKVWATDFAETSGGVAANAAVACARTGTPTRALLRLGSDAAAAAIIASLGDTGVDVEADGGAGLSARATVLLEPHGEKRLLLFRGSGLYPSAEAARTVSLNAVGWVHTTLYDRAGAAELVGRCHAVGIPVSIDLEPASFENDFAAVAPLLAGVAVVFCNDRAADLLGDPVAILLRAGAEAVVRSQGAAGAAWHDAASRRLAAAPPGPVLDTTGAGDCLAGWFVGERLQGRPPFEALLAAVHAASLSCAGLGANQSYPRRQDVAASIMKGRA